METHPDAAHSHAVNAAVGFAIFSTGGFNAFSTMWTQLAEIT